ncbi:MAG TPA: ribosome biogenesis GTP-binding protein YihA/YsxC [Gemmatimonadales bacterium]|nr:ribosome biogenesis GTP-binding protein YihA/YsxC [Gemmatimonadales bacterium]
MSPLANLPVEFLGSFPDPLHRLDPPGAEFAFVGRSNVGKSSLLNALVGRRALARVSSTPGKTAMLNIYRLPRLYLIDLPGYGYANADQTTRQGYRTLLERFVQERNTLTGVVWLLDSRHAPSTEDGIFHSLLMASGRAVLAVLTKADKLTRTEQAAAVAARGADLGIAPDDVQLVSVRTGAGIADLGASLLAATGGLS